MGKGREKERAPQTLAVTENSHLAVSFPFEHSPRSLNILKAASWSGNNVYEAKLRWQRS